MKLFTKEVDKQLFAQYPKGSDLENQMVVAKIFNPYGRGVWYLLNSDPEDPDYIWAIVDLFEPDMGSVSRSELQTVKVPPFGLGLERDIYFTPKPAKEVFDGIMRGERFAQGGMTAGRYYKDNSGNEFRFIGESEGKLLFKDGEKIVTKSEEDFEDSPKEYKLFGIFADGGRVKGKNNQTGESYGVVIGSVKKSDENIEGGTEMNVRSGYSSRISEVKLVFDKNGNLYEITDFGYALEGNYPDTSTRSGGRIYNADKKETLEVLSKKYNPAFAKKLIELAKDSKMAHGGKTNSKRYKVNVYYGGEMEDEEVYTDSLEEAKRISQGGEHSEIYDNEKKEFVEIEYADGGDTAAAEHNIKQAKYGARLVGKQKNLDVNKNGKLDAEDFKILRGKKMAMGGEFEKFKVQRTKSYDGRELISILEYIPNEREYVKIFSLNDKDRQKAVKNNYDLSKDEDVIKFFEKVERGYLAMGGKVKFEDKVKAVKESLLKRKKVSPKVQKDYGKTYDRKEALEAAKRIVGAQTAKYELKKNSKKAVKQ